jgi:hypothetical protein
VRRIQAVVLDFANIEDRLIAVRQTRRHGGRLIAHAVWRKRISGRGSGGARENS